MRPYRIVSLLGLFSQALLWVGLAVGITAITRALNYADQGDSDAVSATLEANWSFVRASRIVGFLGFIALLVTLLREEERSKKIVWGILVSSVVQIFLFPLGTILGFVGLALTMRVLRRIDTEPRKKGPNQPPQTRPTSRPV
ncbi:hypothetical protein [Actomonas aquatica]|uniref:DUF4064 domain-containing protein n=1 Tax=Actomonas aquatica TaxID=2866162 RepID=A0ABZ1CBA4_9BACT|nr:hypothetical protein [Opitutus sp. WL0086]WRQ88836.1 hypothetical protein K1X11_005425 [Opitutus sp. WL0086]